MHPSKLHVVTAITNPMRWQSRTKLFREFERHMLDSGVQLHVIEAAYGEIPHMLEPSHPSVNHIKRRVRTPVWSKECLINLAIQQLPDDWKYVAWIDADILFRHPRWAEETVYALQHHHVVQPWSTCYDLGPHGEHVQLHRSFCRQWVHEPHCIGKKGPYTFAHPGYAWAATRQAMEWLGGLVETAAFGAGDHHMALALVGKSATSFPGGVTEGYKKPILAWEKRAEQFLARGIHYVEATIEHAWHGRKQDRKYVDRWSIPVKHGFDPETDLKRNVHGVLEFAGNKPGLIADMHAYNRSRNEDGNLL